MLAFGSHGGGSPVEIADVKASGAIQIRKRKDALAFSSAIVSIDWSLDSKFIVANS